MGWDQAMLSAPSRGWKEPPMEAPGSVPRRAVALSQEGTRPAYVANRGGTAQIYLRPIDSLLELQRGETEAAL